MRQLFHEGTFENEYLMSLPSHRKLVCTFDLLLQCNDYNSQCSEPILVEYKVAMDIRALSGGRPKDICRIIGCSPWAAYLAID